MDDCVCGSVGTASEAGSRSANEMVVVVKKEEEERVQHEICVSSGFVKSARENVECKNRQERQDGRDKCGVSKNSSRIFFCCTKEKEKEQINV
jgi:hypothetical protein